MGSVVSEEVQRGAPLVRRDLTPAQRAKLIAKRKAAYEAVHPGTKNGGNRRGSDRQTGELKKDRFTADTAAKTGKPERTIQRDATRAKALKARKKAYQEAYPETKRGGDRKSATANQSPKSGHRSAFIDDTAQKTGRSRSAVAQDVARAEALGTISTGFPGRRWTRASNWTPWRRCRGD
jgi:hypothetical protein